MVCEIACRVTVTLVGKQLHWTGNLAAGAAETVTYSVTVHQSAAAGTQLHNTVTTDLDGASCATSAPSVVQSGAHSSGARRTAPRRQEKHMSARAHRAARAAARRAALPCTTTVTVVPAPPTTPPTAPTVSTSGPAVPDHDHGQGPGGDLAATGLPGAAALAITAGVLLTARRRGRHTR